MSDISIPGVNSRFNTGKLIEDLVKAERIPLDRLQNDLKAFDAQKKAWQDVNRIMSNLRNGARGMFNFENPFTERIARSSNDSLTATASREAVEGNTRVSVMQLAQSDRLASGEITKDRQIPEGTYTFLLGEESISLRFRGGSVKDFADALNRRAEGRIKASMVQNRPDRQLLLVESQRTGSAWPLKFADDMIKLGLDLGLIEEEKGASAQFALEPAALRPLSKSLESQTGMFLQNGDALLVKPGAEALLPLPTGFTVSPTMLVEYEVRAGTNPSNQASGSALPDRFTLPAPPVARLRDIVLPDFESQVPAPQVVNPEPLPVVTDNAFLTAVAGSLRRPLPEVVDTADFVKVTVPVQLIGPGFAGIAIANKNTLRDLEIRNMRIYDPQSKGTYVPANPVSTAQDAKISLEGIEIVRDTNIIKDTIPGVTLTLNSVSDKPATVTVEPDRELVKEKVIEFVAQYNAVVREVNILTTRNTNTDLVTEIEFFDDKQREEALSRLGMYQGDSTLSMIKNRLQTILANAYPTQDGQAMAMLSQAGVSTNASQGASGTLNSSRLRGYIEINEKALDQALAEHFLALKDLFGTDTDGDLIADSGVGVEIDTYIRPYVQVGGILLGKQTSVDNQIKAKNTEITNYEEHLVEYEAELKAKFGRMEGSINQLEASSRDIRGLSTGNDNANN